MLLSVKDYYTAIERWRENKKDFGFVKELFQKKAGDMTRPTVFVFPKKEYAIINEENENKNFHAALGVIQNKLYLIFVPLDKNGEIKTKKANKKDIEYPAVPLTPLNGKKLMLREENVVKTVEETTFSASMRVTKHTQYTEYSLHSKTAISERASIEDIKLWNSNYMDWFNYECTHNGGDRIVEYFIVPFPDLKYSVEEREQITVIFGMKHNSVYQMLVPALIFIDTNPTTQVSNIVRYNGYTDDGDTTKDMVVPSPPLEHGAI